MRQEQDDATIVSNRLSQVLLTDDNGKSLNYALDWPQPAGAEVCHTAEQLRKAGLRKRSFFGER
jgi:hypothetical protein